MTLGVGDGVGDTMMAEEERLRSEGAGGGMAGAGPRAGRSRREALGLSPGDVVPAGKERASVFSLPVENDSERRASPPGRRGPDSAVSEGDLSQMLKS